MIFSEERKLINKKRNYYKFKTNILFFNQNLLLRGGAVTGVGAAEADKKIRRNHRNEMPWLQLGVPPPFFRVCLYTNNFHFSQVLTFPPIFPRKTGVVVVRWLEKFRLKKKDTTTVKDFFGDEREIKACKK